MSRRIIGVDLGSYSIKIVSIEPSGKGSDRGVFSYHEKVLDKPEPEEDEEASLSARQEKALVELKQAGLLEGEVYVSGLFGKDTQLRSMTFPFNDQKKINAVLPGMLESQISMELDSLVSTYCLQDSKPSKEDPSIIEHHALVGIAKKDGLRAHLQLLKAAEIDPRLTTLKSAALFEIVPFLKLDDKHKAHLEHHADGEDEHLHMIIDIGYSETEMLVVDAKNIRFARSVRKGMKQISKVLAGSSIEQAFADVMRDIRQTIIALHAEKVGTVKNIFLVGGGSKVEHLPELMSKSLGIACHHVHELQLRGLHGVLPAEGVLAASYALAGVEPLRKHNRINFRTHEFVFKGDLGSLRARIPALIAWTSVCLVLALFYGLFHMRNLGVQAADLREQQEKNCQRILERKIDSPTQCLQILREQVTGQKEAAIPKYSAVDAYIDIASIIPPESELAVVVNEMEIAEKTLSINAETASFELVDRIIDSLHGPCFVNAKRGQARQTAKGVAFQASLEINCSADKPAQTSPTPQKASQAPAKKGS